MRSNTRTGFLANRVSLVFYDTHRTIKGDSEAIDSVPFGGEKIVDRAKRDLGGIPGRVANVEVVRHPSLITRAPFELGFRSNALRSSKRGGSEGSWSCRSSFGYQLFGSQQVSAARCCHQRLPCVSVLTESKLPCSRSLWQGLMHS